MPRLTQRSRDARRQQVVDAARRCFARSGFRATSMQDIFAESGLSAGAVYGYFASKEELVGTIVEEVVTEIVTGVEAALDAEEPATPDEVIRGVFDVLDRQDGAAATLAVQVWAEALHNPALGELVAAGYRTLRERFTRLVRHYQRAGLLDQAAKADDVARFLTTLGPAFVFQRALLDGVDAQTFHKGLMGFRPPAGR
ncbi:TetR/AcrR family transcriptional regulator [Actinophytocola sp.]|uniref:TetR/AcrR family transcriptional regulator n=1 Tax=Actinophytocola sp. TaxID=1872138 RepID=UPI002ED3C7AF